jgi:hypothetical protein
MLRFIAALVLVVTSLAACSSVPNMDAGSAGCQNATGIGPVGSETVPFKDELIGKGPAEAAAVAIGMGHTVVFNSGGDCWCVAPPQGQVTDAWFGQHGALWLWVDGVPAELTAGEPPFRGYGC